MSNYSFDYQSGYREPPSNGVAGFADLTSLHMGGHNVYLTISDVERISGFTGIQQVPHNPILFLGADLNFVLPDGRKILCIGFSNSSLYHTYKTAMPHSCKAEVRGIGDEAFIGPDREDQEPYLFVFRKGIHCVSLHTAITNGSSQAMLTIYQLIDLGKVIASRLR